jgi:antitoxin HicB
MAETLPRFEIRPLSDDDGGGYLIEFPDYPGCMADGETPEAAIAEGRDALASYVATLRELGRPVPRPVDEIRTSWRATRSPTPCARPWPSAPTRKASARVRS